MADEQGENSGGPGLDWSKFNPPAGSSGGSSKGRTAGGAVSSLSKSQARQEIKAIESDVNFLGDDGKMPHSTRRKMLARRDELYRHVGPDGEVDGLAYELEKQGVTKESLEAQQEGFRVRDEDDEMEAGRRHLDQVFGGRERTMEVLKKVQGAVKTWTSGSFTERLFKSGTANSPVIVQAIHTIIEEIEGAEQKQGRKRGRG